jgi:hypothetical protein
MQTINTTVKRLMTPATSPEVAPVVGTGADAAETMQSAQAAGEIDVLDALTQRFASEEEAIEPSEAEDTAEESPSTAADEAAAEQQAETDQEVEEAGEQAEEAAPEEEEPEATDEESVNLKDLDPKARAAAQKVIDRELGKIRAKKQAAEAKATELEATATAAKAEAEQLRASVASLEASRVVPRATPQDPLVAYTSDEALGRLEQDSRAFKRWAIQHPEGGPCPLLLDDAKKPVDLTQQQVRAMVATIEEDLDVHIPRRRVFLQADAEYEKRTVQLFPQLNTPTHELTVAVNDILRTAPDFKRFPGARMGAVYYELGRRLVELHKEKAWEVAAAKPKPAPRPGEPARRPVQKPVRAAPLPAAAAPARVSPRQATAVKGDANLSESAVVDTLAARFGG